jgi:uncharacterized lipoprotein YmbA
MKFLIAATMIGVALLAGGCVNLKPSPDTVKSYTLGPASLESLEKFPGREGVYVARPDLPGYLAGTRFHYRGFDGELVQLPSARWAEPLEEGISRAVSEFLNHEGVPASGGYYPWPYRSRDIPKLHLSILRLGAYENETIQFQVAWEILQDEATIASGLYVQDALAWEVGDASSAVEGFNAGLRALAAQIAAEMKGK